MRRRRRSRVLVLAALLAVAAGVLLACGGGEEAAADFADVDAEDLLARSAARMEQVESFRFVVDHENGTTAIVGGIQMERAEGAVQSTDRMQLDVTASFANTNIRTGIVILPGPDYLQNPLTGRWEEQESIDISGLFDPATGVTGLMRAVSGVEVVAREEVDGVDSYVLRAEVDTGDLDVFVSGAEAGRTVVARVWVGVDDLLVRRIVVEGAIAPDDADDIARRLTLSDFDAPIEITAPR